MDEIKLIEEKTFLLDGYSVKRTSRTNSDGKIKYYVDRLYKNGKFVEKYRWNQIEPIDKALKRYKVEEKQKQKRIEKYRKEKETYFNLNASLKIKLKIMEEEVERYTARAIRWDTVSFDDEETYKNVANYDFYLQTYLSKVENKEEMYIEYLKCYLNVLADPIFYIEVPDKDEFIKGKCEEFGLMDTFEKYYELNENKGIYK